MFPLSRGGCFQFVSVLFPLCFRFVSALFPPPDHNGGDEEEDENQDDNDDNDNDSDNDQDYDDNKATITTASPLG